MAMASRRRLQIAIGCGLVALTSFSFGAPKPVKDVEHFYKPVRVDFWKSLTTDIEKKKPVEAFKLEAPDKGHGAESEEFKLGMGEALFANHESFHAQIILSELVTSSIATRQAFEALHVLNDIAKAGPIDEMLMEDMSFDLDTKIDEIEPRSMVAYFKARALLRKGYKDWAVQALTDIAPNTAWSDELDYDRTMQILASGDAVTAYEHFDAIVKSPNARKGTVQLAKLAIARLIFERRDYKAAIDSFRDTDVPTREKARAFQELAWSYYYDKQYGKALGAIKALKTQYFVRLLDPETVLLEMLIYRELCLYDRVHSVGLEFHRSFADVFKAIEDRLPLENITRVVQTALQEGVLQKRATVVQYLRIERHEIEKQEWKDLATRDALIKSGQRRERITDLEVQRTIRAKVDDIANSYLDMREQVWYLEYEANLRLIQAADTQQADYVPPERENLRTETFFWPVKGTEAWLDELLNYEILVRGICQPGSTGGKR